MSTGALRSLTRRRHPMAGLLELARAITPSTLELKARVALTDPVLTAAERDRATSAMLAYHLELERLAPPGDMEVVAPETPEEIAALEAEAERLRDVRRADYDTRRDDFHKMRAAALAEVGEAPMPSHRKNREDNAAAVDRIVERLVGRCLRDTIRALCTRHVVILAAGAATCAAPDDSGEG